MPNFKRFESIRPRLPDFPSSTPEPSLDEILQHYYQTAGDGMTGEDATSAADQYAEQWLLLESKKFPPKAEKHTSGSSDSPFKIRLDLLKMAQSMHEQDCYTAKENYQLSYEHSLVGLTKLDKRPAYAPPALKLSDPSAVLKIATTLQGFVNGR